MSFKESGLLLFFCLSTFAGFCQNQRTIITYPAALAINLNTHAKNEERLQSIDSLELRKLSMKANRPIHFFDAKLVRDKNGSSIEEVYNFLVMPGDSVIIDSSRRVVFSNKSALNINDVVGGKGSIIFENNEIRDFINTKGISAFLLHLDTMYKNNERRIHNSGFDEPMKKALSDFNYILRCKKQLAMPFGTLLPKSRQLLDSLFSGIEQDYQRLTLVDTQFEYTILYRLLNYHLLKRDIKGDLWDNLDRLPPLPFLKHFIVMAIENADNSDPRRRDQLYEQVKSAKLNDWQIDSIYFSLRDRKPVIENRVLSSPAQVKFIDQEQKALSLADLFERHKGKFLLIDFWASWCLPCRAEFPSFKRLRARFKDQPVAFLNISIDLDHKNKEWKTALAEEKDLGNPNQYRMVDWKNSELTQIITLKTIPRYILLDHSGKILNSNFLRPSDARFEEELKKYINFVKIN